MPIVNEIRVENFRSILSQTISPLSDYEPVVGLNSSGKSNLLRALKLFFTGSIDELGTPLSLARDYSDHGRVRGRTISVGLRFPLDQGIKYPRSATFLKDESLIENLAIQQTWALDGQTRTTTRSFSFGPDLDHLRPASGAEENALQAFVRSIEFRYIPNHVKPSDLIDEYIEPLRDILVSRLQNTKEYKKGDASGLLSALARMGETFFEDVSRLVARGAQGVTVRPDLPTDFAELAFEMALRSVDPDGNVRAPQLEGSGTQSFMFLHLLDLADKASRGSQFGWVQGSIWAIEEPESFLHSGLRNRFANDLFDYSQDVRRQIMLTTHQDEFVRVGPTGVLVDKASNGSRFQRLPSRDAIVESSRRAITSYQHPLLQHPDQPVVIVEGKFDEVYLAAAISAAGLKPRWKLVGPDQFLGPGTAGDALKQYLKWNRSALAARPHIAPIVVVRDWESTDISSYRTQIADHPHSKAEVMPKNLVNPDLGTSWAGIERYLPTSYIRSMIPRDSLLERSSGVVEIDKEDLERSKPALASGFDIAAHPAPTLEALARWVNDLVETALDGIPGSHFI